MPDERDSLAVLRGNLWPHTPAAHQSELDRLFADPGFAAFVAERHGRPVAFAEVRRRAYVPGAAAPDTAFLEGIWVAPDHRRQGIATALLHRVAAWARQQGCEDLGSDALLDNTVSHAWHHSMGFSEVERTVSYIRRLAD